jgi:hypothetical protein
MVFGALRCDLLLYVLSFLDSATLNGASCMSCRNDPWLKRTCSFALCFDPNTARASVHLPLSRSAVRTIQCCNLFIFHAQTHELITPLCTMHVQAVCRLCSPIGVYGSLLHKSEPITIGPQTGLVVGMPKYLSSFNLSVTQSHTISCRRSAHRSPIFNTRRGLWPALNACFTPLTCFFSTFVYSPVLFSAPLCMVTPSQFACHSCTFCMFTPSQFACSLVHLLHVHSFTICMFTPAPFACSLLYFLHVHSCTFCMFTHVFVLLASSRCKLCSPFVSDAHTTYRRRELAKLF